jgi:hypothetical protein
MHRRHKMVKKSKKVEKIEQAEKVKKVPPVESVQEDLRPEMTIPELEMSIRRHLEELSVEHKILGCTAINSLFAAYVFFLAQFTETKDLVQVIMDHTDHVCKELEKKIEQIDEATGKTKKAVEKK